MAIVLDTDVLIETERARFDMPAFLASLGNEEVAISAISASELLHGVERTAPGAKRVTRSRWVEAVLANFPVLTFGTEEARVHAHVWATLAAKGNVIGPHDMLIAATALASGSAVATFNRDEFRRVPGLTLAKLDKFVQS